MTSFQNKLNDLEARLKAENDEQGKAPDTSDFTMAAPSPRRPKPLGDFNFAKRPPPKGLSLGTGLPGEPGSGLQRRRQHFHLPWSPQPQKPPDSHEIDLKYKEIMKASGILTLDGTRIPTHIDDLETLGELGHGTCGHVVKMRHKKTGHLMAVKQMRRSGNREENKRIIMDLDVVLKSHDCPYIVQCLGTFITTSDVWICMELMATCLDKLLKKLKGPVPEHILGKVAVATVNALNYLKDEHGVIHRDVKPSNILIDEHGRIKLCDFGISGRLVDSKAKTRSAGCAAYMAPERIDPPDPTKPDYDIRADVWSLGISLVELATGEFPYKNCKTDFEVLTKVLEEDPPVLPGGHGFSMHFCMFVRACLAKDYRKRPKYRKLLEHPYIQKYEKCFVNVAAWYAGVMNIERPKAQIQQPPTYFARSESYAGPTGPSITPLTTPSLTTPSVDYCLTQPMFHAGSSPGYSDGWSPQSSTSSRVDFSLGYSPSPSPSPSPSGPFHAATADPTHMLPDGTQSTTRSADLGQSRSPNYNHIRVFDPNQSAAMDFRSIKSTPTDLQSHRSLNLNLSRLPGTLNSSHGNEVNSHGRATGFNNMSNNKLTDFSDQSKRSRSYTQPDFADFRNMETRSESGMDFLTQSQGNGTMAHAANPVEFTAHHQHQHQRGLSLDLGQMRHNNRGTFMMPKDNGRSFGGRSSQSQNNGLAMSISSHSSSNPFTNLVSSSYPNNGTNNGAATALPASRASNPFAGNPFKPRSANPFCTDF